MRDYVSISQYFSGIFNGKVRKIPVNAHLGCPGRCIYCNNDSFSPSYLPSGNAGLGIAGQLEMGISFFARKGEVSGYLAYFQSYSNTFGPVDRLVALYEEALSCPGVLGLVIATRPDCLAPDLLDYFEHRFGAKAPQGHPYLLVELGVESTNDDTLKRIKRGHDFAAAQRAVMELDRRGIAVGAHIILGLPGETHDDFMEHARRLSDLPLSTLKLHQLQVVKGTALEKIYAADPSCVRLFTPEEYAQTVSDFVDILRPDIALDRFVSQTPASLLVAPAWGLKPDEFARLLR